MQGVYSASGGTTILWNNPDFHNFQGNCTEAQKMTSTKACNSSVLPAYHLNKSVSGETKDKEKLPAVPDSLCRRGCWKKKNPQQSIFALEVGSGKRGGEGTSSKTLQARTIKTFLYFMREWISSALPAWQQSSEILLCTGFPRQERLENLPALLLGASVPALFEIQQNLLPPTVYSWVFFLQIRFKKRTSIFPLLLSEWSVT